MFQNCACLDFQSKEDEVVVVIWETFMAFRGSVMCLNWMRDLDAKVNYIYKLAMESLNLIVLEYFIMSLDKQNIDLFYQL